TKKEKAEKLEAIPKTAKTGDEYRKGMIAIYNSLVEVSVRGNFRNLYSNYVGVSVALTVSFFQNNNINSVNPEATTPLPRQIYLFLGDRDYFSHAMTLLTFAGQKKESERVKPLYIKDIEGVIKFVENTVKAQKKLGDKFDTDGGIKVADVKPGDVSIGGGGGDGKLPRDAPVSNPTPPKQLPKKPERSDQEKALFAGRAQDAQNKGGGDDEAFKEGQAIIDPDSAIDPAARRQPQANTTVTTTEGNGAKTSEAPPPIVNNQPSFSPQISINNKFVIESKGSPETMEKRLTDLNSALEAENTAATISLLQTLDQRTLRVVKTLLG
ncbi:MAG: hypothetical protein FD167_2928, partial [bacterium]